MKSLRIYDINRNGYGDLKQEKKYLLELKQHPVSKLLKFNQLSNSFRIISVKFLTGILVTLKNLIKKKLDLKTKAEIYYLENWLVVMYQSIFAK